MKPEIKRRLAGTISFLVSLGLFSIAAVLLYQRLREVSTHDVLANIQTLGFKPILFALLLSAVSYLAYSMNDVLALKYIGQKLSYSKTLLASFIGYVFSHNMGHPLMAGGGSRFRVYSRWGIRFAQLVQMIFFYSMLFWMGFLFVAGITLSFGLIPKSNEIPIAPSMYTTTGIFLLLLLLMCALLCAFYRREIRIKHFRFQLPKFSLFLTQICMGSLQWLLTASIFFVLLPSHAELGLFNFLGIYVFAMLAGYASQIPGGWGVFETVIILALHGMFPTTTLLASLILFRLCFQILPFILAIVLFGFFFAKKSRRQLATNPPS